MHLPKSTRSLIIILGRIIFKGLAITLKKLTKILTQSKDPGSVTFERYYISIVFNIEFKD